MDKNSNLKKLQTIPNLVTTDIEFYSDYLSHL